MLLLISTDSTAAGRDYRLHQCTFSSTSLIFNIPVLPVTSSFLFVMTLELPTPDDWPVVSVV